MKKILAICGSARKSSVNLKIILAVAEMAKEKWLTEVFEGIDQLPHFNPDLDLTEPPEEVKVFRKKLKDADGLLICTPEYAMGLPGTLKNAIDWTVSSMEFSGKPVALITAALSGEKAHASLLDTLRVLEARLTAGTQMVVPFVKSKINPEGRITDEATRLEMQNLIEAFDRETDLYFLSAMNEKNE